MEYALPKPEQAINMKISNSSLNYYIPTEGQAMDECKSYAIFALIITAVLLPAIHNLANGTVRSLRERNVPYSILFGLSTAIVSATLVTVAATSFCYGAAGAILTIPFALMVGATYRVCVD